MILNRVERYILCLKIMMAEEVLLRLVGMIRFISIEVCEVELFPEKWISGLNWRVLFDFNKLFDVHSISYLY